MAKRTKGKQKPDEKVTSENTSNVPPPPVHDMGSMGTEAQFRSNSPAEPRGSTWGNAPSNWNDDAGGESTWGISRQGPEEAWGDHTGSLLQPPGPTHDILPTIPEQASEQYNHFRQSLSDIGEGRESRSYNSSYSNSPKHRYAEGPQIMTGHSGIGSTIGSPAPTQAISITEAVSRATAQGLVGQKVNSASDAARKLEEQQRSRLNLAHSISPAVNPEPLKDHLKDHLSHMAGGHTPMSSASAAAALYESTTNRLRSQNKKASIPPQSQTSALPPPGKTTWTYPKTFTPGGRPAAPIPPDYSWTMTGGNAWSNKHRQTKSATVHWAQGSERSWGQPVPAQGQQIPSQNHTASQHMHTGYPAPRSQSQQRPQHQKHLSHPVNNAIHSAQQQQPMPGQNRSWQGWGKDHWNQEEGSETDSEDPTLDGDWGNRGADAWGQQGGNAWEQRDQRPGTWGQTGHQGQGHQQPMPGFPHPGEQGKGGGEKRSDNQWEHADSWGRPNANSWDHPETNWHHNDGLPQGKGRGQPQGPGRGQTGGQHLSQALGNILGQGRGQSVGRGQLPSDSGWGHEDDAWGQHDAAWSKTEGDNNGWGKASDLNWGQSNGEWAPGGRASPHDWKNSQHKHVPFPDPTVSKNPMPDHHKTQIMNAMFDHAQIHNQKNVSMTTAQHQAAQRQAHLPTAQGPNLPQKQKKDEVWEAYDLDNGWGSVGSGDDEYDPNRRVHFSPKTSELWGGSPRSLPSKTLAYAQHQKGIATTPVNLPSGVRFVESRGAAFSYVHNAFFGNSRLARERIHWMFPANKDERVADMLAWVQKMSFNLATFGLIKFLETRERGALFLNAVFRMHHYPTEPAFDWLTFNQLQSTMDKTLQESVAFYDPSRLVTVFVYLPSQSGNSVAIWRRKINVPDSARTKYQTDINAVVKTLRAEKDYVVMVDEIPKPKLKAPPKGQLRKSKSVKSPAKKTNATMKDGTAQKKRKWWKFFLS